MLVLRDLTLLPQLRVTMWYAGRPARAVQFASLTNVHMQPGPITHIVLFAMLEGIAGPEPWRKCCLKSTGFQADLEFHSGRCWLRRSEYYPGRSCLFCLYKRTQLTSLPSLFAYHKKGKSQQSGPALDLRVTVLQEGRCHARPLKMEGVCDTCSRTRLAFRMSSASH